jgi:hypothetical protein
MSQYQDPQMPFPSDGRTHEPPLNPPNKGTGTGFIPGMGGAYGADTDLKADNRIKGFGSATDSDPMEQCYPENQQQQNTPGRRMPEPNGKGITAACDSDAWKDETPKDQRY